MPSPSARRLAVGVAVACAAYACGHDPDVSSINPTVAADAGVTSTRSTSCRAPLAPPAFVLTDVFPGLTFTQPIGMVRADAAGNTYFVAEQLGTLRRVTRDPTTGAWRSEPYLDISDRVVPSSMGDGGLIGVTVSPDWETTGEVFITYTGTSTVSKFREVIARVHSAPGTDNGDLTTMEDVLSIERTQDGHNGGKLVFGPDRMLYIAIGDGWYGDPLHRAQDLQQIFGKLLRIDVLHAHPYVVPPDNPFVGTGVPEIWAYGFKNPWSYNFDSTGRIWLGDVGQDHWEEVDLVTKGGNYGWSVREGAHCYLTSPCDLPGAIDPVWDYPHVDGWAVTGGYVYAGSNPALKGLYLFGDYISGRLWSLDATNPAGAPAQTITDTGMLISGFSQDENGELLIVDWGAGHVSRLDPDPKAGTAETGATLSSLGCLSADPSQLEASMIPYDVNAPLWADGLDKRRWVKTPAGTSFHIADDGSLQGPAGTILMKEMSSAGKRIETRMMVNDPTYGWQGFSFAWKDDQTDAVLVGDDGQTAALPDGGTWQIPSRGDCFACHRHEAGTVLGFITQQLNKGDQLTTLTNDGLFDKPMLPGQNPSFADPSDTTQPVDARARSYLHANCAHCHNAWIMNLQDWIPVSGMNVLCTPTSFGGTADTTGDGLLADPSNPAGSLLVQRMQGADGDRMPPLGTTVVDTAGVALVTQWIAGLGPCPATTATTTQP